MDRDEKQVALDEENGVNMRATVPYQIYISIKTEQLARMRNNTKVTLEALLIEALETVYHKKKEKCVECAKGDVCNSCTKR